MARDELKAALGELEAMIEFAKRELALMRSRDREEREGGWSTPSLLNKIHIYEDFLESNGVEVEKDAG